MKVENLDRLIAKLKMREAAARRDTSVSCVVGYTAAYALFVHENREVHAGEKRKSGIGVYWGPSLYGPNFLAGPAREYRRGLAGIIREALQAGKSFAQSLLLAGLRLQRESQRRVPVEHGNLRASAFTRLE